MTFTLPSVISYIWKTPVPLGLDPNTTNFAEHGIQQASNRENGNDFSI